MRQLLYMAAQQVKIPADKAQVPQVDASVLLTNIVSLVFGLVGTICVIVIVVGGFRYVISQGDSGAVSKAKNAILYAVVGLVVSLFAFTITQFVSAGVLG